MTATKLQMVLGEAIEKLRNLDDDSAGRKREIEKLEELVKLAKQLINNHQVILQGAKMLKNQDRKEKTINLVLGA